MGRFTRRQFTAGLSAGAAALSLSAPLRAAGSKGRPDVIILGAGMSGLYSAWLLEQQGLKVLVLEGRQRVGGRVHTLFDLPGTPEMGFNSMGEGYGRAIDCAQRAGLELIEVGARYRIGKPQDLYLDGALISRADWANSPRNPFPEPYRDSMPWEVLSRVITTTNPLTNFAEWQQPASKPLDVSINSFLSGHGFSQDAIRLANDLAPFHGINSHDTSVLLLEFADGFAKNQHSYGPGSLSVKGGNELLPRGLANLVKGDILLGKTVTTIDSRSDMAEVRCADGTSYTADKVICSLPFSTLRSVHITPGMPVDQTRAIDTLPYQPISTIFMTASQPFWDEDGQSPWMWTDSVIGSVTPQRYGRDPQEITGFMVQARGELALRWDRMGHKNAMDAVRAKLEEMRPAARGKLTLHNLYSWTAQPFNAGDWAYFHPGQLSSFVPTMARPHGRIHFCGEHTAQSARGMEGALESSERATMEILLA